MQTGIYWRWAIILSRDLSSKMERACTPEKPQRTPTAWGDAFVAVSCSVKVWLIKNVYFWLFWVRLFLLCTVEVPKLLGFCKAWYLVLWHLLYSILKNAPLIFCRSRLDFTNIIDTWSKKKKISNEMKKWKEAVKTKIKGVQGVAFKAGLTIIYCRSSRVTRGQNYMKHTWWI